MNSSGSTIKARQRPDGAIVQELEDGTLRPFRHQSDRPSWKRSNTDGDLDGLDAREDPGDDAPVETAVGGGVERTDGGAEVDTGGILDKSASQPVEKSRRRKVEANSQWPAAKCGKRDRNSVSLIYTVK